MLQQPRQLSFAGLASLVSLAALAPAAPLAAHPCGDLSAWHTSGNGPVADFATPVGVIGLWRAGGGPAYAPETGIAEADLACPQGVPCRVDNFDDGRSLTDFERYEVGGETYFALVFTGIEQRETLLPRLLDETDFAQEKIYQQAMDMHLVDFEAYVEGGVRRWAALFQEGVAHQELALDMTAAEIQSRVATPSPRMRRLVEFEVLPLVAGINRYAAFFDDGPADQKFFTDLSAEDFHFRAHQARLLGYRLRDVESWVETPSGALRFAALFERATGDDHLYALACNRNGLACSNPVYFAQMEGHLVDRTLALGNEQPLVRLIDLEFPRGAAQLGFTTFSSGPGGAAATPTGRSGATQYGEDPPITNPTPPHCNHAGVLHDAGTNGPP